MSGNVKMKARILDLAIGLNRKQRLTLELSEDFTTQYGELKDCDISVIVKKYRKRRSLDANAYCWVLIGKLAAALGITPVEVYREAIRGIGNNFDIVPVKAERVDRWMENWMAKGLGWISEELGPCRNTPGYVNTVNYYGSSVYDSKEMSLLVDRVVQDCKDQGIETMTEFELDAMKDRWTNG